MSQRRAPSGILNRLLLAAMMAVMTAAALLPAGWMPHRSSAETLTLVLCTPDGPQEVQMPLSGDTAPSDDQSSPQTCVWALAQALALVPDLPVIPAAPEVIAPASTDTAWHDLVPNAPPRSPVARGPPLST